MHLWNYRDDVANRTNTSINGQQVRIYGGTPPANAIAYGDGSSHTGDLLASDTITTSVFETSKITTTGEHLLTASGTGTATWFVIYNTTNNRAIMSDCSDIAGSGTMILSTTSLVTGVDFNIDDFEIVIHDQIEA